MMGDLEKVGVLTGRDDLPGTFAAVVVRRPIRASAVGAGSLGGVVVLVPIPARRQRQTPPRQAVPRQAVPRQAAPRQAVSREAVCVALAARVGGLGGGGRQQNKQEDGSEHADSPATRNMPRK